MLANLDADSTTDVLHDEIHCSAEQGRRQNASLPYSEVAMNGAERHPVKRTLADVAVCRSVIKSISTEGSHASCKVLESAGFFSLKFQDLESPGKSLVSWKLKFKVLESPGKLWLKIMY